MIYEPSGKAREYSELAVNLYNGCDHGCTYCYVPAIRRCNRETHEIVSERKNALAEIAKDIRKNDYTGKKILFCFMTDPYCTGSTDLTRKAAEMLLEAGAIISILTKGGKRSERDFDLFEKYQNAVEYGATLTFTDERWTDFEPGAAPPSERIAALERAHSLGMKTWISLEPVLDTTAAMDIIKETSQFVDVYKVGVWNYDSRAKMIDWKKFGHEVRTLLESLGKEYYLKEDLLKRM